MRRLVLINFILILIFFIIPTIKFKEIPIVEDIITLSENITITKEEVIIEQQDLHMSDEGLGALKTCEGFDGVAVKYTGEKYYTIGHGHYGADVKKGQTITREQADELLRNDMLEYEGYVKKWCGYLNLNQNEFDAMVIFVYNLGEGNLKKLTANKTRSKEDMMNHILNYTSSRSEINRKGLLKRRTVEKNMFEKGEY